VHHHQILEVITFNFDRKSLDGNAAPQKEPKSDELTTVDATVQTDGTPDLPLDVEKLMKLPFTF